MNISKYVAEIFQLFLNLYPFDNLQPWPEDALEAVAKRFLQDIQMSDQERYGCIEMCKVFHTTALELSSRFFLELERHNYVTPTSYLELISTFKTLLNQKRG